MEKADNQAFTHLDADGRVRMVDVTEKDETVRTATAQGAVYMTKDTLTRLLSNTVKKGNVLETARIAGVMAAKRTSELIPMCHPLAVSHVAVDFLPDEAESRIRIEGSVRLAGKTGVEMEALTAVSVAALTIYDMCKSYDRGMMISEICLMEKAGGKSGVFKRSK